MYFTLKDVKGLNIECWNIRTMLNTVYSGRPECCSVLIAEELSRQNVNIIALSEVCFPLESSFQEQIAEYHLL